VATTALAVLGPRRTLTVVPVTCIDSAQSGALPRHRQRTTDSTPWNRVRMRTSTEEAGDTSLIE
jgi:hypothetical protein